MNTRTQIQLFLLVLAIGFLAGPRAIGALQKLEQNGGIESAQNREQVAAAPGSRESSRGISTENLAPIRVSPYAPLSLKAKSVFVWDIQTHRKRFGYNEYAALPLASVTKMMMALVATELLPANTSITIASVDLLQEGDTGLYAGETWTLSDLLNFTLVASSNDGASAIASVAGATLSGGASSDPFTNKKLFIAKMNARAKEIGLENTHFTNESGLDIESVASGAYGSARDMAMLFEYVLKKHPELFTPTTYAKLNVTSGDNIIHRVANTNAGVEHVTGLIASKTGYTDIAGGNLVLVVDIGINHPVVIAVLGSTRDGRFTDAAALIEATVLDITERNQAVQP